MVVHNAVQVFTVDILPSVHTREYQPEPVVSPPTNASSAPLILPPTLSTTKMTSNISIKSRTRQKLTIDDNFVYRQKWETAFVPTPTHTEHRWKISSPRPPRQQSNLGQPAFRSAHQNQRYLLQQRMEHVIDRENDLNASAALASTCSKFDKQLMDKQMAPSIAKSHASQTRQWMGKRHMGKEHLHSHDIELLQGWFKSLDINHSGTISFDDMRDPLIRTEEYDGNHIVNILKSVSSQQDQQRRLQKRASRNMSSQSKRVVDNHEYDMTFRNFIDLFKGAMHNHSGAVKKLVAQVDVVMGQVDTEHSLPTDISISMARRKFMVDSFFHRAQLDDRAQRLVEERDMAAKLKHRQKAKRATAKLQTLQSQLKRHTRRNSILERLATKDVGKHLRTDEEMVIKRMQLAKMEKANLMTANVITKLRRKHWDSQHRLRVRKNKVRVKQLKEQMASTSSKNLPISTRKAIAKAELVPKPEAS